MGSEEPVIRIPEWAIDVLLWQEVAADLEFAHWLVTSAFGVDSPVDLPIAARAEPWHIRPNGETDLLVTADCQNRTMAVHIEDKIDAVWSGGTQPQRYEEHTRSLRDEASLLIAPEKWVKSHADAELFGGRLSYEQVAAWLDAHSQGDVRRQWVAARLRAAAVSRVRAVADPALDIDAWVGRFADLAQEYDLQPKRGAFVRKAGTSGKLGRFIADLVPCEGPGSPVLLYKLVTPAVGSSRVDLKWARPEESLAETIADAAEAAGHDALWSPRRSEFYVRVDGGEAFGGLSLAEPLESQLPQARAMLRAAADLRNWWHSVGMTIGSASRTQ